MKGSIFLFFFWQCDPFMINNLSKEHSKAIWLPTYLASSVTFRMVTWHARSTSQGSVCNNKNWEQIEFVLISRNFGTISNICYK